MEFAGMVSSLGTLPAGQLMLGGAFALEAMMFAGLSLSLIGIGRSIRSTHGEPSTHRFPATGARAHLVALASSR